MIHLPKISLPAKRTILDIVTRTSKKHLIVAIVIGVIAISSGTLLTCFHTTNKQKKELVASSKVKSTPTVTPTITLTPTPIPTSIPTPIPTLTKRTISK